MRSGFWLLAPVSCLLVLLCGCHTASYRRGWLEGYKQADRWHHGEPMKDKTHP